MGVNQNDAPERELPRNEHHSRAQKWVINKQRGTAPPRVAKQRKGRSAMRSMAGRGRLLLRVAQELVERAIEFVVRADGDLANGGLRVVAREPANAILDVAVVGVAACDALV